MSILCIDLKSFFASCECVKRNLDPFKTPLVVANKSQGSGAMTLAVTPYLKDQGVKSRSRLYEIPKGIKYTMVNPNMALYKAYSIKVRNIFLEFVAEEDLLMYSIDEAFLNVAPYLKLYKKTDIELATEILKRIKEETNLTACCGIGPNMFLAKTSLDIEAKDSKNFLAKWDYSHIEEKLYNLYPLSKIWGIGKSLEKKLNNLGIFTPGELVDFDINILKKLLGKNITSIYENLQGKTTATISSELKREREKSFSRSKILLEDVYGENIFPFILNLINDLAYELRSHNYFAKSFKFSLEYSKTKKGGFFKTFYYECGEQNPKTFYKASIELFNTHYNGYPIRKIEVSLTNLIKTHQKQLCFFDNKNSSNLYSTIDKINKKTGNKITSSSISKIKH